jgi:hypothetical protein
MHHDMNRKIVFLILLEVFVLYRSDVSLADPTEVSVAIPALDMVASSYFLDWSHASWTTVKLVTPIYRPFFEVHRRTLLSGMPLSATLEAHIVTTLRAYSSFLTTTGLLDR